jgi:hypothetical protein
MLSLPLTTAPNCWGFLPLGNDMVRGLSRSGLKRNFGTLWHCVCNCVSLNFDYFFFAKIKCGLYFLDRFDVLISKIIFKKWKNIIDMYFGTKSYLKSTRNHTAKHAICSLNRSRHFAHKKKQQRERKEKEAAH